MKNTSVEVKIDQAILDKMGGKIIITMGKDGRPCFAPAVDVSGKYAENSSLYGKIMNDGYVFNPYLHRRWLPVQYMKMLEKSEKDNMNVNPIIRGFGANYSLKVTKDEIARLAILEKNDKETFNERKQFYTLQDCKDILVNYCEQCIKYCKNIPVTSFDLKYDNPDNRSNFTMWVLGKYTTVSVESVKYVQKDTPNEKILKESKRYKATDRIYEFCYVIKNIMDCTTYAALNNLIHNHKFYIVPNQTVCDTFVECYKKSGAYYTLAELITFNNCRFYDFKTPVEAMNFLKNQLSYGIKAYQFHAMLKECLAQNHFNMTMVFDGWSM